MITKISGEQPFQVLTSAFSISPSASGYQLQISADGVNYSTLFSVGAGVTRLVTGVAANSYYKLAGNTSDVVVNWQKSCNGDGGGGGGTGTTITVDSELSTASTNPVENRVITNALNNLPGAEVDDELSSSSTHAVENRVIYDALNGTSATTELQVLDTDSVWKMKNSGGNIYPLKNTTIENLKAIYLGDIVPSGNSQAEVWFIDGNDVEYKLTVGQGEYGDGQVTIGDVGNSMFLFATGSTATDRLVIRKLLLDGTYEYYLLFDVEKLGCVVYKNLPTSITEVSDHSANISDLPTAQDGSNFKQYVYNIPANDYKRVVSNVVLESTYTSTQIASLRPVLTGWNNSYTKNGTVIKLPAGSEAGTGVKTVRDSVIIDRAEEALSGMTEQVTLTIGSATTGSANRIYVNNSAKNLYTTNDPRYYVYDLSMVAADGDGYWNLGRLQLSGTRHQITNPYEALWNRDTNGKYQLLATTSAAYGTLKVYCVPGTANPKYAIVDTEMLTVEITDSLTITRTKSIQQMIDNIPQPDMSDYVSKDELTGSTTENPIVLSNTESAWRAFIAALDWSYSGDAYFKETNYSNIVGIYVSNISLLTQGLLTYGFGDGNGHNWMIPENTTATTPDVRTQLVPQGNGEYDVTPQSSPYYLLLDTVTGEFWFSFNPTVSTEVPGILDNYWTTGETQTAIQEALYGAIITGATTPVDDHLDSASTWPVENRVITNKFGDYYTKDETDAAITAATQNLASTDYVDAAITAATQNFVTSGDVTTAITSATQNFITSGDVTTIVDAAVATAITIDSALSTGSTNPVQNQVITNALANCVQSTDVRTMVKCTLAEYNAMQSHDPNTFYIIVNS